MLREETVILVDDDAGVREALADVLRLEGYEVSAHTCGKALLAAARVYAPPALVIMDLALPDMSGDRCMRALRGGPWASVPVLIFSGWEHLEQLGLEAQGLLSKTCGIEALLRTVHHLVSARVQPARAAAPRARVARQSRRA
jgi:DNA-binding response OmpR family regulator